MKKMKTNTRVFKETFAQKHLNKVRLKESLEGKMLPEDIEKKVNTVTINEDVNAEGKVANIINQLKTMDSSLFYVALMIYDVLNIERPSEKLIDAVRDYVDEKDTVYDEFVRDEIRTIAGELDEPLEVEEKEEVKVEEPVEEKLGEFKKSSKKNHKENKDFIYKE